MKKLKLELGSIKEMLSKEQMKMVVGGYDSYGGYSGNSNPTCKDSSTHCTLYVSNGSGGYTAEHGHCSSTFTTPGDPNTFTCYCWTEQHQTPTSLSSGGGVSHCTA